MARLAREAVGTLVDAGCKLVVVACNTATAAAIDSLREAFAPLPIVGMEPAVKPACLATRSGVVGVLATERSLDGDLFRRTAARYGSGIEVVTAPGRGFVELVESDREDTPEAERTVRSAVAEMLDRGADQIVLGCTHYPFLIPVLERVVAGRDVSIVDPSPAVARRVVQLLDEGGFRCRAGAEALLCLLHLRRRGLPSSARTQGFRRRVTFRAAVFGACGAVISEKMRIFAR